MSSLLRKKISFFSPLNAASKKRKCRLNYGAHHVILFLYAAPSASGCSTSPQKSKQSAGDSVKLHFYHQRISGEHRFHSRAMCADLHRIFRLARGRPPLRTQPLTRRSIAGILIPYHEVCRGPFLLAGFLFIRRRQEKIYGMRLCVRINSVVPQ